MAVFIDQFLLYVRFQFFTLQLANHILGEKIFIIAEFKINKDKSHFNVNVYNLLLTKMKSRVKDPSIKKLSCLKDCQLLVERLRII